MSEKIIGDFDVALRQLIERLKGAKDTPGIARFASHVLWEWDYIRGTDWYTNTKLREEKDHGQSD